MQLFKHMEVVLLLAFATVGAGAYLPPAESGDRAPSADAATRVPGIASNVEALPMAVVHVVGRRPTMEEQRARGHFTD
jgi:hypothetical protein